jgi:hypothetical protein
MAATIAMSIFFAFTWVFTLLSIVVRRLRLQLFSK